MNLGISWHVWKPSNWQAWNGFTVREERCRYHVQDGFMSHQCERKPKVMIQGYGFCTQHAKKLLKRGFTEDREGDE